jgi:hypothetical protein
MSTFHTTGTFLIVLSQVKGDIKNDYNRKKAARKRTEM